MFKKFRRKIKYRIYDFEKMYRKLIHCIKFNNSKCKTCKINCSCDSYDMKITNYGENCAVYQQKKSELG